MNAGWTPTPKKVWDYVASLSEELIERGFDEIQYDYIRFPTDGDNLADARYRWREGGMDRRAPSYVPEPHAGADRRADLRGYLRSQRLVPDGRADGPGGGAHLPLRRRDLPMLLPEPLRAGFPGERPADRGPIASTIAGPSAPGSSRGEKSSCGPTPSRSS
jgi:hypothetical protein